MFVEKSLEEISKMTLEEQTTYQKEKKEHEAQALKTQIEDATKNSASKEDVDKLTAKNTEVIKEIERLGLEIKRLNESPKEPMSNGLRKYIEENSEVLKSLKANGKNGKHLDIVVDKTQSTQVATDITNRDAYTTVQPGTIRKPVRRTRILDLFKRTPISGEFFRYQEEDVVTRDAKFVVACAKTNHTTKKNWVVRTVELAKIRDIVDACIDMLDDYTWVESQLKELIDESIMLKADYELLLGTGTNPTDMLSIETISSEFNPANVLADFTDSFQDANVEQLADAMSAQIQVFGQENKWIPNTVVMNFTDFVKYRNLKDKNGNRLIHTLSDSFATLAGMEVVTSPTVDQNTMYVMDTMQGEILDRQSVRLITSFENNDNVEHETVTFVATTRLQFHVPTINRNAFMKCSDVATAIAAITEPTT